MTTTGQDEVDVPTSFYNGVKGDNPSITDLLVVQCVSIHSCKSFSSIFKQLFRRLRKETGVLWQFTRIQSNGQHDSHNFLGHPSQRD